MSYSTVFWNGRWAVTEFIVKRTITFHITTRSVRATSLLIDF